MENCFICEKTNIKKKCKTCDKKCCYDCKTTIFVNNKNKCFWCLSKNYNKNKN